MTFLIFAQEFCVSDAFFFGNTVPPVPSGLRPLQTLVPRGAAMHRFPIAPAATETPRALPHLAGRFCVVSATCLAFENDLVFSRLAEIVSVSTFHGVKIAWSPFRVVLGHVKNLRARNVFAHSLNVAMEAGRSQEAPPMSAS